MIAAADTKNNYFGRVEKTDPGIMMDQLTDKALLVAEDAQLAFRHLYDRYWEPLYSKARYRLGNDADAQDVVQGVFISLWRNRESIEVGESLSPYLFTALKYCIIKTVHRQAKRSIHSPMSVQELERTELSIEELLQYKELKAVIETEVANLPDRMKEIFCLSRVECLSITEIAERLNLSEQTVKNTLTTALKKLREKLARHSCWLLFSL